MPLKYESPEFSNELKKRVNANKEYREKAKGMNWKTLVIVRDIPFATYTVYLEGEMLERRYLRQSEIDELGKKTDFTVEIPTYDLSVEMATGKKSMESLFLGGAIKLDGSIFKALQYRSALEKSAKITAELANESTIPSKEEFAVMLQEQKLL